MANKENSPPHTKWMCKYHMADKISIKEYEDSFKEQQTVCFSL